MTNLAQTTTEVPHDALFKELISTFLFEFLELFAPAVLDDLDRDSVEFLPQEAFADLNKGKKRVVDILVKAKFRGVPTCFLIHVEVQAARRANFAERMFLYYAVLYTKYRLPIFPIALFSYDKPRTAEPDRFSLTLANFEAVRFNFLAIQLNRMDWREFLERENPVATALMAKMRIAPEDRPKVKLECLQMLRRLGLNPARDAMIAQFIDAYLQLTPDEKTVFNAELGKLEPEGREQVMKYVTSWEREGIRIGLEQGIEKGRQQGEILVILKQLERRFGRVSQASVKRIEKLPLESIEELAVALLDFEKPSDLTAWLKANAPAAAA